ncbi:MAG: NUDIX hydrolase [Candidatus Eisenbacteria bacterium]
MKVTETVYEGKVLTVVKSFEPDRPSSTFEMVRHPGAAAVVAVTEEGRLVLINQYREAVGKFVLEIPAGKLEPDESPDTCARRELEEETGYRPGSLEKLCEFFVTPGYSDERIHVFAATNLVRSTSNPEENEVISPVEVTFADAFTMIDDGRIQDAKTLVGILTFARKRRWSLSL